MILRAEIYVVTSENSKKLYGACEKQVNPNSVVSSICAFTKQCERFVGTVNFAALVNLLEGREK